MAYIPHAMQLLAEQKVSGNVTDVTFSNLHEHFSHSPEDRMFRLSMSVINVTGSASDYLIFFAGDTTITNYHSNALSAANGVTDFTRVNTPRIINAVPASPNGMFYGNTDIMFNDSLGLIRWISMNIRRSSFPIGFVNYAGTYDVVGTFTDLFSITIHSTTVNAIGNDSIFRLFRISPT
jgi:hypothetical protein